MESNHCVCINDYTEILKNLINSILSSSGILHRTNSPATDSGYTQMNSSTNNINNSQSNSGLDLMSTGFYLVMMLIGVLIVLTGRPKKKNSDCK